MMYASPFTCRLYKSAVGCTVIALSMTCAFAQGNPSKLPSAVGDTGPDLDLTIQHYHRVMTSEGVLKESRYEENMLRRPGHVWISRVLPQSAVAGDDDHGHPHERSGHAARSRAVEEAHKHKHINYAVLPRHVIRDTQGLRLEYVNMADRAVISIAPPEYENVSFDGSWPNAFFLVDPQKIYTLPLSKRVSLAPEAQWRELEKNGVFQRVLWDEKRMVPLVVEVGNRAGTFFERIEVKPQSNLTKTLPWTTTKGFAQKEYTDYLD